MLGLIGFVVGCVAPQGELALTGGAATEAGPVREEVPEEAHLRPRGTAPDFDERDDGDVLFGAAVHPVALSLSEAGMASLRTDPRSEVEAELAWRGRTYRVGVRLKGSASFRTIDEKPSLKIDVHAFDREAELDGAERLTLNNMIQDPTMLREHAGYWLFTRMGLPAPRHGYARLAVNGADYGLYSVVETMDEELLKRAFADDPDGNLYESSGADFIYARDWFELEETTGAVSTDDIDALVDAVEGTPADGFLALFEERFVLDRLLTYLAVDIAIGNDDGYVFNHHNYYAYHGALSDRWELLPWGLDRSFTREVPPRGSLSEPVVGRLAQGCWENPECADALTEALLRVLGPLDDELSDVIRAAEAQIREHAEADPRAEHRWDPDDLLDFVEARGPFLYAEL